MKYSQDKQENKIKIRTVTSLLYNFSIDQWASKCQIVKIRFIQYQFQNLTIDSNKCVTGSDFATYIIDFHESFFKVHQLLKQQFKK
jgi:hypothetical protein